jgi:transposase
LAGDGVGEPRSRGRREAIRVLLTTRAQAVEFRTRAISALHALVTSAPDGLRERLRALPLGQLLRTCASLRGSSRHDAEEAATTMALRATARRALACEQEATALEAQILILVRQVAPGLLDQVGVGPLSPLRSSPHGPTTAAFAPRRRLPSSVVSLRSRPLPGRSSATG